MTVTDRSTRSGSAFWPYWWAMAISMTGTGVTAIALPLVALTMLDASGFEVGLVTAASYGAIALMGLPAGVVVRRYRLRSLQISMDLVRAAALLTVPLAAAFDVLSIAQLVVVAFVVGVASSLFDVANMSFLPAIVGKDELIARNSLISGTHSVTTLAGPSLGGALVQLLGAARALLLDVVSYLASAFLLSRIPPANSPESDRPAGSMWAQMVEGLAFVSRHPVLRPTVLVVSAANFVNGALLATLPIYLLRTAGLAPALVGLVIALDSIGGIAGAAVTTRLVDRLGTARALLLAATLLPPFAVLLPISPSTWGIVLLVAGNIGLSMGMVVLGVVTRTYRQAESPPELLTRVMASVRFISWGVIPLGALVAGTVSSLGGPAATLWTCAALLVLAPLSLYLSPIRRRRTL
jgi:MFS family permease